MRRFVEEQLFECRFGDWIWNKAHLGKFAKPFSRDRCVWYLLLAGYVLNHVVGPLFWYTSATPHVWDWAWDPPGHGPQLLLQLPFYCAVAFAHNYTRRTLRELCEKIESPLEAFRRRPTINAIRAVTFLFAFFLILGALILADVAAISVTSHPSLKQSGLDGYSPTPLQVPLTDQLSRRGYPVIILDWVTWGCCIIPVCTNWFAMVFVVVINAGTLLIDCLYEKRGVGYVAERYRRACRIRHWLSRQVVLYLVFLGFALLAFHDRLNHPLGPAHAIGAYAVPVLLTWPLLNTWFLLDAFRSERLRSIALKLPKAAAHEQTDLRIEYGTMLQLKEALWPEVVLMTLIAVPLALMEKVKETLKIKKLLHQFGSGDHLIASGVVLAMIVALSLGYLRHARLDRKGQPTSAKETNA